MISGVTSIPHTRLISLNAVGETLMIWVFKVIQTNKLAKKVANTTKWILPSLKFTINKTMVKKSNVQVKMMKRFSICNIVG